MVVLGIETSCDETAVAVLEDGLVRSNLVASQVRLHAEYGGVVPELAARAHLQNLPELARLALREAGVEPPALDLVAATRGPGLPTALRVGWRFAQAVAFSLDRPIQAVHHHEGHLFSPWFEGAPLRWHAAAFEPHVALVVSGGHTLLVDVPA
ncbi:MAG: tRNA (adenosine(37)-N6)-threonylcarbamoyltransferase complex transferase subunit TsaD, partial [Verrucomicrobia bacterium]